MTTRFKALATSAVLLGSLGALGLAAVAPAQPDEGAAPPAAQAPLGPSIAPLTSAPNARELTARVATHAPITRIQLLVDGRAVARSTTTRRASASATRRSCWRPASTSRD